MIRFFTIFIITITLFSCCQTTNHPVNDVLMPSCRVEHLDYGQEDTLVSQYLGHASLGLDTGTYTYAYSRGMPYNYVQAVDVFLEELDTRTKYLHFKRVSDWESADFRFLHDETLGWTSYHGKDIFKIPRDRYTTTFGKNYSHTFVAYAIRHEIVGHLILGAEHEQHNRQGDPIDWNMPALYAYRYKHYGEDKDQVDSWVVIRDNEKFEGTDFDPNSIMLYYYPCELVNDNRGCDVFNYFMSNQDWQVVFDRFGQADDYGVRL